MNDIVGALFALVTLWAIVRIIGRGKLFQNTHTYLCTSVLTRVYSFAFLRHVIITKSCWFTGEGMLDALCAYINNGQVNIVKTMFPDIPEVSIRYDLILSGSAEATCDRILQQGYLPLPPADFPGAEEARQSANTTATASASSARTSSTSSGVSSSPNLISRFHLEHRLQEDQNHTSKGKGSSQSMWSPSAKDRQESLQERKAQMILQARKRMEERQSTRT